MESVLVDTDVFSFLFKKDARRDLYAGDIRGKRLCLSFMSVAELKYWTIKRKWSTKRIERLTQTMRQYVVLPYDAETADRWAEIAAHRESIGQPIACGDCWIASAALRHDLPLVTHNRKDFVEIPHLRVVSHAPH
jgi:tRNA(fMet)-specific endonuclease VapC